MNNYLKVFIEENKISDPEVIKILKSFMEYVYDDIYDEGYNDGYEEGMEEGEEE